MNERQSLTLVMHSGACRKIPERQQWRPGLFIVLSLHNFW